MTPVFGFSVGDFISAINLVQKVGKALKEAGGASTEYQQVFIELNGLASILRHLETLEPTEDNVNHVNAIRGMALACQLPLQDFMVKLNKYESSLGPFADKRAYRGFAKKSKWAISFAADVDRLRTMVAAKNLSISMLLLMDTSQKMSCLNTRGKERHNDLMTKVAEHRGVLQQVKEQVVQIEEEVSQIRTALNLRFEAMEDSMSQTARASSCRLDQIDSSICNTQSSISSLRSTGERILRHLERFPQEMRELLHKIMQGNWQMYQVLLQIQKTTARSPSGLLESNIRFEDALGDYRELPYEYFRHWGLFEEFLRSQFKDKPGEKKVAEGQYHIVDLKHNRAVIKREHWNRSIEQGAILTMSMIMSHIQSIAGSCPRPKCSGGVTSESTESGFLTCATCKLKFHPQTETFAPSTSPNAEEEQVLQSQVEEDLRLYGSRQEPTDASQVDVVTQDLPIPEQITSFLDLTTSSTDGSIADITENASDLPFESNIRETPLFNWLSTSAGASMAPRINPENQESRDIEVFRNVHVALLPEPTMLNARNLETSTDPLELPAQIYYRNIIDRYPRLPLYLAHRLAEANLQRAKRLSTQRINARTKATDGASIKFQGLRSTRPSRKPAKSSSAVSGPTSPNTQRKTRKYSASIVKPSYYTHALPTITTERPNFEYYSPAPQKTKTRVKSFSSSSKGSPQFDYWTGMRQPHRPRSSRSRSSSRNSSLHGHSAFAYQKQYQYMEYSATKNSSYDKHYSDPGLPLPPSKACKSQRSNGKFKRLTFACDICGEKVRVSRRKQWQEHVMADLRPYICTAQQCDRAAEPFRCLNEYLIHEAEFHEWKPDSQAIRAWKQQIEKSIVCIFCGDVTDAGKGRNGRGRHVGRHMEEIAFAVVSKPYEKWEFYSDSASIKQDEKKPSYAKLRPTRVKASRSTKPPKAKPLHREATVDDSEKHGIPAGYSLKKWDPNEEPFLIFGSVFDSDSLGKWIYDWSVFCHGAGTPGSEEAGEFWLLLIKLFGKMKRADGRLAKIKDADDRDLVEEFLDSGDRLRRRLKQLLKSCERCMWEVPRRKISLGFSLKMGEEEGRAFIENMFGPDGDLEATRKLMQGMRLWCFRFEANCEEILL